MAAGVLADSFTLRNAVTNRIWIAVLVIAALTGCRALENHFIFDPTDFSEDWQSIPNPQIQEAYFRAADGTLLHGMLAKHADPRAVILFAHGRQGNVSSLIDKLLVFVDRHQVSVMVFDYRGYGRSGGKPDELGVYQDARAARKWLAEATDSNESDVVLMGRSLGAAVAIELAANDGARGLVVESGFTSLSDFVKHHAPPVPADLILFSKFDSLEKIGRYRGPVLVSHGRADRVIPFKHGKALFDAAAGPKHFFRTVGGHEADPTHSYQMALDQFISDLNFENLSQSY